MKTITLAALLTAFALTPAMAQDQARTKEEIKAEGKSEQARIKADTKVNKALNEQAQANVKADAEADKKKLKAQQKADKKVNKAMADVNKADTKAEAAKASSGRSNPDNPPAGATGN